MKEKYSIGEVSEIFKVPKSTLRYWDSQKLLEMERNAINDYREYSVKQIVELSDIAFYRSINIPIEKLKRLYEINIDEFDDILQETQKDIDEQIEQLKKKRQVIIARRDKIKELKMLQAQSYTFGKPDMERMYEFDVSHFYDQNPYNFAILISAEDNFAVQNGSIIMKGSQSDDVIWESSQSGERYVQCLLKVSPDNPECSNLLEHLEYMRRSGYEVGAIVGRYLITAMEEIRYDFYKIWMEVME